MAAPTLVRPPLVPPAAPVGRRVRGGETVTMGGWYYDRANKTFRYLPGGSIVPIEGDWYYVAFPRWLTEAELERLARELGYV